MIKVANLSLYYSKSFYNYHEFFRNPFRNEEQDEEENPSYRNLDIMGALCPN